MKTMQYFKLASGINTPTFSIFAKTSILKM